MDLLEKILKRILSTNPDLASGVHEARILELWGSAMGEAIARHTRATHLKGSTLFVSVDHPVWRQELHANKRLALQKLNETLITALGKPANREFWIEELFLGSEQGRPTSKQSKGAQSFRKK